MKKPSTHKQQKPAIPSAPPTVAFAVLPPPKGNCQECVEHDTYDAAGQSTFDGAGVHECWGIHITHVVEQGQEHLQGVSWTCFPLRAFPEATVQT